jgi:hypothetical protein
MPYTLRRTWPGEENDYEFCQTAMPLVAVTSPAGDRWRWTIYGTNLGTLEAASSLLRRDRKILRGSHEYKNLRNRPRTAVHPGQVEAFER